MNIESLVWKIIFVTLMVVCLGLASIGVIIWFVALDTPLFLRCIVSVLCLFLGLTFFMLWLLCFLDTRKEKSMAEYIEREALLKKMKNWHEKISLVACVNSMPAADVAPVRHGRWIMHDDEFGLTCECSACHIETMGDGNYCPNCGAKMELEER